MNGQSGNLWAAILVWVVGQALGVCKAEELIHVRVDDGRATSRGSITGHRFLPNGHSLAYIADQFQRDVHDLFVADLTTGSVINLSHVPGYRVDVVDFRVSPDGQLIAYWGIDRAEFVRRLYSVSVSGGPPRTLAVDLNLMQTETAPFEVIGDSDTVVFGDDRITRGTEQLWRVPIAGGNVEALSMAPATCLPSPDHLWLAISETYQIPNPVPLNYTALSLLNVASGVTTPLSIAHSLNGTTPSPSIFHAFTPDSARLFYIADDSMRCINLPGLAVEQLGAGGADVGEILPGNDRIITLRWEVTKSPNLPPATSSTTTSITVCARSRGTTETLTLAHRSYTDPPKRAEEVSRETRSLDWPRAPYYLDVSPDGKTVLYFFKNGIYRVQSTGGEDAAVDPATTYYSFTAGNGHAVLRGAFRGLRLLDYNSGDITVLTDDPTLKFFFDPETDRLCYLTGEEDPRLVSISLPDVNPHVVGEYLGAAIPSLELAPDHDAIAYTVSEPSPSRLLPWRLVVVPWDGSDGSELFNTAIVVAAPVTALVALGHDGNSAFYQSGWSLWRRSSLGTSSVNLGLMNKWAISSSREYLAYMYHYTSMKFPFGGGFYRSLALRTVALGPSGVSYTHLDQSGVSSMHLFNPPLSISADDGFVSTTDIDDNPVSFAVDDAGAPLPAPGIVSRESVVSGLPRAADPPISYNGSPVDWGQVVVSRTSADGRWIALLAPLDGSAKELYAARLPDGEAFKLNRPLYPQTDVEDDFLINANGSFIVYRANEGEGTVYLYGATLVDEAGSAFITE